MDFLKAQVEAKKRSLDALAQSQQSNDDGSSSRDDSPGAAEPPRKFFKASDLEKIRAQDLEREVLLSQARRIAEHEEAAGKAFKFAGPSGGARGGSPAGAAASPAAGRSRSGSAEPKSTKAGRESERAEAFNVSNEEAIRRLRNKGQPIRLFGETDRERRLRLRALELIEVRGSEGQRNDFARALESAERGLDLQALLAPTAGDPVAEAKASTPGGKIASRGATPGTPATGGEDEGDDVAESKKKEVLVDLSLVKTDPRKVYPQIYHALKRVLKEWEQSLNERPDSVKRSQQGKLAAATQQTTADYLKPLFKALRKRDLEADVLRAVAEITHHMQTREYIKANDSYLRLSIGNAPWPIGVTMVGIHERSGREKIFSHNVAHVLNDETSRKYIQSLKRLLTFAQSKYPPDDVSQKMG